MDPPAGAHGFAPTPPSLAFWLVGLAVRFCALRRVLLSRAFSLGLGFVRALTLRVRRGLSAFPRRSPSSRSRREPWHVGVKKKKKDRWYLCVRVRALQIGIVFCLLRTSRSPLSFSLDAVAVLRTPPTFLMGVS